MGCLTHVSTSSELQIVLNPSQAKAKNIFRNMILHERCFISIFYINRIKVPIASRQVKPPELTKSMGNT